MRYAIGVDLGGTKIEAALVDEEGNKLEDWRVPTEVEKGPDQMLANIEEAVNKVRTQEIVGIGIGIPGFIHNNQIASAPNVHGIEEAVKKFSEKHPGTVIANDANCFALGEHRWGAGRGTKNMLGVIIGTGIGSGIIIENKLFEGSLGGAGEIGHVVLDYNEEKLIEGGPGTFENLCSGKHIVRRYREAGGNPELDRPDKIFASEDEIAQKLKHDIIKWIGVGLGAAVQILNPEKIVLGGGVSNIEFYDEVNAAMKKFCNHISGEACQVVKNQLGDSAGVLGAAALVLK